MIDKAEPVPSGKAEACLAFNLSERLSLGNLSLAETTPDDETQRVGFWRLRKWRDQSPFDRSDYFARRLTMAGLTEEDLLFLASETPSALSARLGSQVPRSWRALKLPGHEQRPLRRPQRSLSWLGLLAPALRDLDDRLRECLVKLAAAPGGPAVDTEGVLQGLVDPVARSLESMLARAVVLEMKLEQLERGLVGNNPRERFLNFVQSLSEPERATEFFMSYPVAERILSTAIEAYFDASSELLSRLWCDWQDLAGSLLSRAKKEALVEVKFGAGDRHRSGRSVAILLFDQGTRLVYKPRELSIDLAFDRFLDWFASVGGERQRLPRFLPRDRYGWCEYVESTSCNTREEMSRFFRRQGEILAILHCLRAHDFHRENLIASGEFPVLVDLETLFGPDYGRGCPENYTSRAGYELANSVKRVMLLPYLQEGSRHEAIEQSGLGGSDGQRSLLELGRWTHLGTDEMRFIRERQVLPNSHNHPRIGDKSVDIREYEDDVVQGFESGYRILLAHREVLLGPASPLQQFAGAEVRVIFRDTAFYSLILRESFHPDLLRNALDRDCVFDRLWFGMDTDPVLDSLEPILPHEISDLWKSDVPYFTCSVDSRDVTTSQGIVLPGFLLASGLDMVRRTVEGMSEGDLEKQSTLARASFAALTMTSDSERERQLLPVPDRGVDRQTLLGAADSILKRLRDLAYQDERRASWIGLRPLRQGWQLRALGPDLYSGLPGIAITMAHAGRLFSSEEYLELSLATLATLEEDLRRSGRYWKALGAYMGWGGVLYTYLHLADLWQDEQLLKKAISLLPTIRILLEHDTAYDLIFGSAGCVPSLLHLWHTHKNQEAFDLAVAAGDRILGSAREETDGIGWVTIEPGRTLTGISHGNSGFAWILSELFKASGADRFRFAAEKAIRYEESVFDSRVMNWPDLRTLSSRREKKRYFAAAWCNGAGGIGMARLRLGDTLDRRQMQREAEIALNALVAQGFGDSHCLCHGDLGNLDILQEAADRLGGRWIQELERMKGAVLSGPERKGWRCGVPRGFETPGLMEGLSGMAYGLMRLADPVGIPSILLLDLPSSLSARSYA